MPDAPDAEHTEEHTAADVQQSKTSFVDWLAQHRNGVLDVDLADAFAEVVNAVIATGKAGSVTLTLKVDTTKGDMLAVTDVIAAKVPEINEARLYWRDLDGTLTRDNPLQPKLVLPPSSSE